MIFSISKDTMEQFINKKAIVYFHSRSHGGIYKQIGVVTGFASIHDEDDYLVMEDAKTDYPGGPGAIRVERICNIQKIEG